MSGAIAFKLAINKNDTEIINVKTYPLYGSPCLPYPFEKKISPG